MEGIILIVTKKKKGIKLFMSKRYPIKDPNEKIY